MIIPCIACNVRYFVPADEFAGGARMVRCSRCLRTWKADLPPEIVAAIAGNMAENPMPSAYKKRGSIWLKVLLIGSLAMAAMVVATLAVLLACRENVVKQWPDSERYYNKLGITIDHVGNGLSLLHVRSERQYEGGGVTLTVDGEVHNDTRALQHVPDIWAIGLASDGKIMQRWRIQSPAATLLPEVSVPFHFSANTPQGGIVELNLNFAGPEDHDP